MQTSKFRMLLDMQESVSKYELNIKEGDQNTRGIKAVFSDGGEPYLLDSSVDHADFITTIGGDTYEAAATISDDGSVFVMIPTFSMTAGIYECEFHIYRQAGAAINSITSPSFRIVVNPTV